MASLTALPTELLIQIASYLDKDDSCAVRLSSKRLAATASYMLFHTIRLYPSPKSIEKYYAFLESPELNKSVRHVYLNTVEEIAKEEEHSGQAELSTECRDAFESFGRFPNLKSASLRFSNNATSGRVRVRPGEDSMQYSNWPQTTEFRRTILDQFFKTLADPALSNVKDISIRNLQNINDPALVNSKHFKHVMSRLTSLRLYIATEHYAEAPEEEFLLPE
ncbi:hypothetical protein SLS58_010463 [Diplodia intermedia]|uniref:F-box domain-containing protein n=1 Tax=Diplodia intermedia TaxID=856260 RepID=A0ABR3T737_9PEZI